MRVHLSHFVVLCSGWQKQCYMATAGRSCRAFWLDEIWLDLLAVFVFCQGNPTHSNTNTHLFKTLVWAQPEEVCVCVCVCVSSALAVTLPFQVTGNTALTQRTLSKANTARSHQHGCTPSQLLWHTAFTYHLSIVHLFVTTTNEKHVSASDDTRVPSNPNQTWMMGHYQSD